MEDEEDIKTPLLLWIMAIGQRFKQNAEELLSFRGWIASVITDLCLKIESGRVLLKNEVAFSFRVVRSFTC